MGFMDGFKRKWRVNATEQAGNDISGEISGEIEALIQMTELNRIAPGRVSSFFVLTLFGACKAGRVNPFMIAREIEALDDGKPTGLKPPIQNRYPPLKGLWHKHYMQNSLSAMAMNIRHGLRQFGIPFFKQKICEAEAAGELRYLSLEDLSPLTRDVVEGNWERLRKAERITGEWIVFAKHEGQNYYLCLATHDKSTHQDLRRQIDSICCREFPFLQKLLADGG